MEELIRLSEKQLITRAENYYKRIQELSEKVSKYLDGIKTIEECIRNEYAALKQELREEYNYFQNVRNEIWQKGDIYNAYQEGVSSAWAHGFKVNTNAKISIEMLNTIDDALEQMDFYLHLYPKLIASSK